MAEITGTTGEGDHPRVCGEHAVNDEHADTIEGSSPRMRGTRISRYDWYHSPGIIPAYAGNTRHIRRCLPATGDHPRVCGEHGTAGRHSGRGSGSSPRMRGTPLLCKSRDTGHGIIPAYAGNTSISCICLLNARDHPRVCGEHRHRRVSACGNPGSSPRMRGTPDTVFLCFRAFGIIPAYAGNTSFATFAVR